MLVDEYNLHLYNITFIEKFKFCINKYSLIIKIISIVMNFISHYFKEKYVRTVNIEHTTDTNSHLYFNNSKYNTF
jgi:hypothetical protein